MGLDKLYVLFGGVERTPKVCTDLAGTHRDLYVCCSSPIKTRSLPERGPLTS